MTVAPLPEDLHDAAVALWHACALTRPWNDPYTDLLRAVRGPASEVLAVVDGGALKGTVMVGHDGHRGWLYYLAVDPGARRQGLGSDLVRAAEEWLRERGVPKAQLMVRRDNEGVVGFYEALGYADGEVVVLGRFLDR